jgi:hypothetical protein
MIRARGNNVKAKIGPPSNPKTRPPLKRNVPFDFGLGRVRVDLIYTP